MSVADLKARMRDIPGIDSLTMRLEGGKQVFTVNGASSSVGAFASDSEIEDAIRSAARLPTVNITEETKPMSITGFQPGAIKAAIQAAQQAAKDRQEQSMATLAAAGAKAVAVADAIDAVSAKMAREADDALQELAQFTNGAPD